MPDLGTFIEGLLKSASAHSITNLFLLFIFGVFFYSIYKAISHRNRGFIDYAPNLMTSLGILGTFAGIVVGLLDFDTNQIETSIGGLLDGLKTAFITSLAGMFSAILFKGMRSAGLFDAKDEIEIEEIGPEDVLRALKEQSSLLQALNQSISGGDDTSLVGQIKQLRLDTADGFKRLSTDLTNQAHENARRMDQMAERLWEKLDSFAEMLSKSATEQVINALKEVIMDFNKNLTEQFGDNFKALDASVQKLVEWQARYREELEQMQEQYAQGVQAITTTEAAIAHISEQTDVIPKTMQDLRDIMTVNRHQIAELERHLDAFREMRDKAVAAVPEIQQQIEYTVAGFQQAGEKLTSSVADSAEKIQTAIIVGAEEFSNNAQRVNANLTSTSDTLAKESLKIREQLEDAVTDLNKHIRIMIDTLSSETSDMSKRVTETATALKDESVEIQRQIASTAQQMQERLESVIEELLRAQSQTMAKAIEGINAEMQKIVGSTGESVNEQMRLIDQVMQQEIERVMQSMGNALATISGQFTADYRKLVDRMREITSYAG